MSTALLRYPADVDARLDALLDKVREDAEFRAVRLSRSALLRMCVFDGLDALERRYGLAKE
jgi:hypothetical protein